LSASREVDRMQKEVGHRSSTAVRTNDFPGLLAAKKTNITLFNVNIILGLNKTLPWCWYEYV